MGKKPLALFVVLVLVIGAAFWFAAEQEAQRAPKNDIATDVKRGELTDRQRIHSELYKGRRRDTKELSDVAEDKTSS